MTMDMFLVLVLGQEKQRGEAKSVNVITSPLIIGLFHGEAPSICDSQTRNWISKVAWRRFY
jgi:hypothetical protein